MPRPGLEPVNDLLKQARACTLCPLPHEPRPVFQASPQARVLIIGQAPGSRVHASGVPWDDDSGDRLRDWLGVDKPTFYSPRIALLPMGFCYPGKGDGGDLPPRPECAPKWHPPLLAAMPRIRLTVLAGMYAQKHYLRDREKTLTATVKRWRDYEPRLPTPHPAWRARLFMGKNPWFAEQVLPELKRRVAEALCSP